MFETGDVVESLTDFYRGNYELNKGDVFIVENALNNYIYIKGTYLNDSRRAVAWPNLYFKPSKISLEDIL